MRLADCSTRSCEKCCSERRLTMPKKAKKAAVLTITEIASLAANRMRNRRDNFILGGCRWERYATSTGSASVSSVSAGACSCEWASKTGKYRSEENTSELQSP